MWRNEPGERVRGETVIGTYSVKIERKVTRDRRMKSRIFQLLQYVDCAIKFDGLGHMINIILLHVQRFILNSRLGSSANPFLHRPFPFLPD